MTPELALQKQIERYREMTCEERILISLRLHELASQMARVGIRATHPQATDEEVELELHQRRKLAWKS
jgi:hypothetical protein